MKKNEKMKKYYIAGIVVIVLLIFLIIYHYANRDNGLNHYKMDTKRNIVYDVFHEDKTHVPCINLKSEAASSINSIIVDRANDFLEDEGNIITYDYYITGKILSLAIQYVDMQEAYPTTLYDVYHINVYTSKVYSDSDLLDMFQITQDDVEPIVEGTFQEYYQKLYNEGIYHGECNYKCFLYMRGIQNEQYMDGAHYYLKDGNLYVLRPFQIYSPFQEENYFTFQDFLIQITE